MSNPLTRSAEHPPFDEFDAAHIAPAVDTLLAEGGATLASLEQALPSDWAGLMVPIQALEDRLDRIVSVMRLMNSVRNHTAWREAVEVQQPRLIAFRIRVRQSQVLYRAMKALEAAGGLSGTQQRILQSALRNAEHNGVHLDEEAQARLNVLAEQLSALQMRFGNNVLDSVQAWSLTITDPARLVGLPDRWRSAAAARARAAGHDGATAVDGPWVVTLDHPCTMPVFQHAGDRALREEVRRARGRIATTAPHDNSPIITEILAIRAEMAAILGYTDYPDKALASRMAGSVDEIEQMMRSLHDQARPGALDDHTELNRFAAAAGHPTPLQAWDTTYWSERLREERFALRDEDIRPYFALDNVLTALFGVCRALFGVEIVPAAAPPPTWHPDVRVYTVHDPGTPEPRATIYLDPYVRPADKRSGAWMTPMINRSGDRRPVAVIACNLPAPTDEAPCLPGLRGARTMFHEFGHALQHVLTEIQEVAAAGIQNVEWDAVELPSTFMENWLYHQPVLAQIAHHHETGEPIEPAVLDRIREVRRFQAASGILAQVSYALQDLAVHQAAQQEDPFAVALAIREKIAITPLIDGDSTLCSFQHIFAGAYAAGYYSYLWAEVLSADAFMAFEEGGLDDSAAVSHLGRRFRETVLARGGSQHPLAVFEDFRGRPPSPEALLRLHGIAG